MEHLPIHLPYEAIVGGPVQYRWMYPFERELHDYKKKAKNKACIEGSICEAYIIQEISTFCSHYFEPDVPTRLNKVGRNDDVDEVDAPDGCLSIFLHPGRPSGEKRTRYLLDEEFEAARLYVLLNCEEVQQYVNIFEAELKRNSVNISLEQIEQETNTRFAEWFEAYVLNPTNNVTDERLKNLACGPWNCWSIVPDYKRDQWFNDFEKNYSFSNEDRALIRKTFERVGSERLSDNLGKAKRAFLLTDVIPGWISQPSWDLLMQYWNSDDFKNISVINSNNRKSSNNGEGPSLHTGGSVAFAEYKRRHKEQTEEELRDDELFLMTHKTKKKEWICGKSHRIWNTFTENIKKKADVASTSMNEDDFEVDDEEGEQNSEDTLNNLLQTMPKEQLLNSWVDAIGGAKKGKIYGLGTGSWLLGEQYTNSSFSRASTSTSFPTPQIFETPEFEKLLGHVLEQQLENMQANIEASVRAGMKEDVEIAVRVVVGRMLGLYPQPATNSSTSLPTQP